MTGMFEVVTVWSGFAGAPGYTNHYFIHSDPPSTGAQSAVNNVRAFWNSCASVIPSVCSLLVQPVVKILDDAEGELTDILTVGTPPTAVTGGAAGTAWSGPVGMCVDWETAGIHGYPGKTRRVRGRTFIVPTGSVFESGTPNDSFVTTIQAAATALRTATGPTFGVWARPRPAKTVDGVAIPKLDGAIFPITANRVPDKSVVLRSRRD